MATVMGFEQHLPELQFIFAPAVLISASALMLLGFQNRYTSMVARFRNLNEEKRRLLQKSNKDAQENTRLQNLIEQVQHLVHRTNHIKNAMLLQYAAISFFILTSAFLFLNVYVTISAAEANHGATFSGSLPLLAAISFITGLMLILSSAVLMMREVALAYHLVFLEAKS